MLRCMISGLGAEIYRNSLNSIRKVEIRGSILLQPITIDGLMKIMLSCCIFPLGRLSENRNIIVSRLT